MTKNSYLKIVKGFGLYHVLASWYVLQGASPLWLVIAIVDGVGAVLHLRKVA